MEPAGVQRLQVAVKGALVAVLAQPDYLQERAIHVDLLHVEVVQSLVKQSTGRGPVCTEVQAYHRFAPHDLLERLQGAI